MFRSWKCSTNEQNLLNLFGFILDCYYSRQFSDPPDFAKFGVAQFAKCIQDLHYSLLLAPVNHRCVESMKYKCFANGFHLTADLDDLVHIVEVTDSHGIRGEFCVTEQTIMLSVFDHTNCRPLDTWDFYENLRILLVCLGVEQN